MSKNMCFVLVFIGFLFVLNVVLLHRFSIFADVALFSVMVYLGLFFLQCAKMDIRGLTSHFLVFGLVGISRFLPCTSCIL
jgi:hypothetical protein